MPDWRYETRGPKNRRWQGRKAVGMALALTTWTTQIVICTNGEDAEMTQVLLDTLKPLNIPVLEAPIKSVTGKSGEISSIELEGGMSLDCERLYFAIAQYPADDLVHAVQARRIGSLVSTTETHVGEK